MDRVLVLGQGGREHALAWKLAQSPQVERVFCAPGNPGTAHEPKVQNLHLASDDHTGLVEAVHRLAISLVVIGPEAPLVAGVADRLRRAGVAVFGPNADGARLEGSKLYAKAFMARHGLPTAAYGRFTELDAARAFLRQQDLPIVVKADGLASGKGVVVASSRSEAEQAVDKFLRQGPILIESFLEGEEASYIAIVADGQVLGLAGSQDHKRLLDRDQGPNTGGMGAYSPAPVLDPHMAERVRREIMVPAARGLMAEGISYRGFLYAGLMIGRDGPRILEFNCRLGDPETQPLMLRLRSDLYPLLLAAARGEPLPPQIQWDPRTALCVVLAAAGYPDAPRTGDAIHLPAALPADSKIFQAGTCERDGTTYTQGGRVLGVTVLGADVAAAQRRAYDIVQQISWPGMQFRRDIGWRARA
ncbi:phosphoribosylamine--glycine ligase [Acidithiobacillus sp.]|uniref:phosphoribosylamine--glycine ligase n=1 Tax=Acidithiobacillus sp. TaxID=1872118 RepID=UPI0025C1723A|nr:phosphoribosylamine--glycine ligase [Acidithiobacillus sp.]